MSPKFKIHDNQLEWAKHLLEIQRSNVKDIITQKQNECANECGDHQRHSGGGENEGIKMNYRMMQLQQKH